MVPPAKPTTNLRENPIFPINWLSLLGRFWPYAAIAALSLALYVQGLWLDAAKSDLVVFTASVEAAGHQAAVYNKGIENGWQDKVKLAEANARIANKSLADWLRKNNTPSGSLPESTGTPKGTDRKGQICFDETSLDGALRRFTSGVAGLIGEGQAGVIDARTILEAWPK